MLSPNSLDSGTRIKPVRKYALRFSAIQILIALVVVMLIIPLSFVPVRREWWTSFARSFFVGLMYANCCGWLAWFVMPHVVVRLQHMRPLKRWTFLIFSLVAIGGVGALVAQTVFTLLGSSRFLFWGRFWRSVPLVILVSVVTGILWFVFESARYRAQYATTQAKLKSLESRIHPHFLFNTLNSIAALIPESPQAAERMTVQLATLLRSSLNTAYEPTVLLEEELKIVTDYLEIEKVRFGPKLNYDFDVPAHLMRRPVPPFSIQTLVENSIKHGGNSIRISAFEERGRLALTVWDSGPGFSASSIKPGHGLHNLRLRMALIWGERATLDVYREDGGGRVRLTMPGGVRE
jgi:two-component system, LytTR family, sensor histidine kinase AlgZ